MHYWTPDREKINNWIVNDLGLPVFAEVYNGAVCSLFDRTPGHVTFICHACRDIMTSMAREYKGGKTAQVNYRPLTERIDAAWPAVVTDAAPLDAGLIDTSPESIPISRYAHAAVDALVKEHRAGKARSEDLAYLFFTVFLQYSDKQRVSKRDLDEWKEIREWFLDHTHLRKAAHPLDTYDECKKRFLALEQMLLTAADSVRSRLTSLDEILRRTN
jgi:hypothetical protein